MKVEILLLLWGFPPPLYSAQSDAVFFKELQIWLFILPLPYLFAPQLSLSTRHALKMVTSVLPVPYFFVLLFFTSVNFKTSLALEKCKAAANWNSITLSLCYILETFFTFLKSYRVTKLLSLILLIFSLLFPKLRKFWKVTECQKEKGKSEKKPQPPFIHSFTHEKNETNKEKLNKRGKIEKKIFKVSWQIRA